MLRDRGMKKWQGFFLPEHIKLVKEEFENQNKIKQPILDEDKLNDIDILIHEGMEDNLLLKFSLFNDGYINTLLGRTVYIDYLNNKLRIQDEKDQIHHVSFSKLVDVERA
ncbi:YolD-like family protein [Cytobacillus oceanisediminis]|uniref:YolD-like family protein n=1 Tax=Cytobacillus oceanisediminis TaxID=665099 RepID=UPI001CCCC93D|nr:YolD-like family protein [Cytobacillus oceanisediminis]MBZ9536898.1 YolD-like family protein [Cytobacillus oceanisediminis]